MDILKRFGVSMEQSLLQRFDSFIKRKSYKNRSEAIRDLIRELLVEEEWVEGGKDVAGAIIMVYDHHKRELVDKIVDIQHDFHDIIISSQHVHLDHHMCLEVVTVKGDINKVFELESKLKSIKGVKHTSLARSTLGKEL
ncbi:MAG: nickel-responsive transcriptional regulator NikR [Actinobacteria bacterium]|nr:nickel-responsive transcriptional regulator NikR [Actinomycetota bacterium]